MSLTIVVIVYNAPVSVLDAVAVASVPGTSLVVRGGGDGVRESAEHDARVGVRTVMPVAILRAPVLVPAASVAPAVTVTVPMVTVTVTTMVEMLMSYRGGVGMVGLALVHSDREYKPCNETLLSLILNQRHVRHQLLVLNSFPIQGKSI